MYLRNKFKSGKEVEVEILVFFWKCVGYEIVDVERKVFWDCYRDFNCFGFFL